MPFYSDFPRNERIKRRDLRSRFSPIIPLREKIGNYDLSKLVLSKTSIIPLREKIGNYDGLFSVVDEELIIPLREKIGNYDVSLPKAGNFEIIPLREKIGNYDALSIAVISLLSPFGRLLCSVRDSSGQN